LSFLFFCPLLSFIFAQSSFPLGGALGSGLIEWTNGFAGKAGSVFMLIAVFLFFVTVIFQWDIKPWLLKAKNIIPARKTSTPSDTTPEPSQLSPLASEAPEVLEEEIFEPRPVSQHNNTLKEDFGDSQLLVDDEVLPEDLELTLVEKSTSNKGSIPSGIHLELPQDDEEETAPLQEIVPDAASTAEITLSTETPAAEQDGADLDFEIKTTEEEQHIPANGAHITIQSGEPYDPSLDLPKYKFPTLDLLDELEQGAISLDREELEKNKNQIINTLRSFGIEIQRISATVGPTV